MNVWITIAALSVAVLMCGIVIKMHTHDIDQIRHELAKEGWRKIKIYPPHGEIKCQAVDCPTCPAFTFSGDK